MQGHGISSSYGAIWQVIPVMEGLLHHFEDLKQKFKIPDQIPPMTQSSGDVNAPASRKFRHKATRGAARATQATQEPETQTQGSPLPMAFRNFDSK